VKTLLIALRAFLFSSVFVFLWGWLALNVSLFDSWFGIQLPEIAWILGVLIMAAGGLLALVCVVLFVVEGRGTPTFFDAPREFVAHGPYQFVRNPMYVGGDLLLIGFGLYHRSFSMLLFGCVWAYLAHLFVLYLEEPFLRRKFGSTYDRYCSTVPRWVPKW
jgi:protein-S-isoprenylcysteine O-methyltransferase Ste14